MGRKIFCFVLFFAQTCCFAGSVESDFFNGEIRSRVERLETYPLEQQYRIFLYGNQTIHPPATGLALPLARKGKPALDYILEQLSKSENDLDFRDSLVVFQMMQWGGHYNVCADVAAMEVIKSNKMRIHHAAWRNVYSQMLHDLCRVKQRDQVDQTR